MQTFLFEYTHLDFPNRKYIATKTHFGDIEEFYVTELVNGMPGQQLVLSNSQFDVLLEKLIEHGWTGNSSVD